MHNHSWSLSLPRTRARPEKLICMNTFSRCEINYIWWATINSNVCTFEYNAFGLSSISIFIRMPFCCTIDWIIRRRVHAPAFAGSNISTRSSSIDTERWISSCCTICSEVCSLNVTRVILNVILCWAISQCKCSTNGLELEFHAAWSKTWAGLFWIRWSLLIFAFGMPYRSDDTDGDHLDRLESQTSANMSESTDVMWKLDVLINASTWAFIDMVGSRHTWEGTITL